MKLHLCIVEARKKFKKVNTVTVTWHATVVNRKSFLCEDSTEASSCLLENVEPDFGFNLFILN
jgi:hypothetical protein